MTEGAKITPQIIALLQKLFPNAKPLNKAEIRKRSQPSK